MYYVWHCICRVWYGMATISRLLKIIRLFCKRALWKRRYSYVLCVTLHLSCHRCSLTHNTHEYMYTWIHIHMNTCTHEFTYTCIHLHINSYIHVYMYAWIHIYMYTCTHKFTYTCIHVRGMHDRCSLTYNTYEYRLFHRALLQKRRIIWCICAASHIIMQHTATHCNILQHTATYYNTLNPYARQFTCTCIHMHAL